MRARALATIARSLAVCTLLSFCRRSGDRGSGGCLGLRRVVHRGGLGGVARRLVGFAHPDEHPRACRHLADSQAWLELLHDAADSG
jgi:hypothetical protein